MKGLTIVSENCLRLVCKDSVHYLYRDKIVDMCMDTVVYDNWSVVPCLKIFERKKFLGIIPYKKCTIQLESTSPNGNIREVFSMLYEWWKFNKEI